MDRPSRLRPPDEQLFRRLEDGTYTPVDAVTRELFDFVKRCLRREREAHKHTRHRLFNAEDGLT